MIDNGPVQSYWEAFIDSLWAPESWFKVLFLLAFWPIWGPTAKAMLREIIASIKADGENTRNLSAGEDPFLNVPLASYRKTRSGGNRVLRPAARPGPAPAQASRTGFSATRR